MLPDKESKVALLRPANAPVICDVCGKQLARQSDMPRHKRLHDPKPDRWMHWCPEPGCDYGSMQSSNLRNHVRKHTGQRLRCPDDSTCNYSSSDKSALLRHRQRKHGYQAKPTAPKDRRMKVTKNRMGSSKNSIIDSSSSPPSEHVTTDPCCPRCSSPTVSSRQACGAINDETDIWQGDHASTIMTKQPVESIERSLEGHVTSRFPVSFARTRLPHGPENGALTASRHCRCRTCGLRSIPVHFNSTTGSSPVSRTCREVKVKEVVVYRHVSYLVEESVSGHMRDRSRHHLTRTGGALTSYSRVSSL